MNSETHPNLDDGWDTENTVPGYDALRDLLQDRAIGRRTVLPEADRLIAVIASLCVENRKSAIAQKLHQALDIGITPRAISECLLQTGLYGGLPLVEELAVVVADVFDEHGVTPNRELLPEVDKEQLCEAARQFQRKLHGERQQTGHSNPQDEYTAELYSITSQYGYGMIWRRPGISLRQRLIIAIACFATLSSVENFLIKFARSAIEHDLSRAEVREIVVQIAPYIGFPRALSALTALRTAFTAAPTLD